MKDRIGTICKVIVIVLAAMLVCMGLIILFDSGFNGAVGDWFVDHFIIVQKWSDGSSYYHAEHFNWPNLKSAITFVVIFLVVDFDLHRDLHPRKDQ